MKNPVISSRLPQKVLVRLDRYAKRNKLTRSAAIAELLEKMLVN